MRADSLDVSIEFRRYVFVCRSVEKLRSVSQLVIGRTQAMHNRVYIYIRELFFANSTNSS